MKKTGLFRKSSLFCILLICVMMFSACSAENDLEASKAQELEASMGYLVYYLTSSDQEAFDEMLSLDAEGYEGLYTDYSLEYYYGLKLEPMQDAVKAYLSEEEELGSYKGDFTFDDDGNIFINDNYTATESASGSITVIVDAQFSEHDAELEFYYDEDMNLEAFAINTSYSTGEILSKAGLNTLLGMGMVFAVLILMSFIISLFRFIPALEARFTKKKAEPEKPAAAAPVAVPAEPEPEDLTDDLELVAVITAAVAALQEESETAPTGDGFVVRSIKRRKSNRW